MGRKAKLALNESNDAAPDLGVSREVGRVACRQLLTDETKLAPEWFEVIPSGVEVIGRDGRAWTNESPDLFVATSQLLLGSIPVDYEHGTEQWMPPTGKAAGWVTEIEAREGGSIWCRVEWTPAGRKTVEDREYRFVSPAFFPDKNGNLAQLVSIGLTNTPNLRLKSLNTETRSQSGNKEENMNLKEILKALGLREGMSAADAVAAINSLKADREAALNSAGNPSMTDFVPRADYQIAMNRAEAAETKVKAVETASHAEKVEAALNAAVAEFKIAPSSVEYLRGQCGTAESLAGFVAHCSAQAAIIPTEEVVEGGAPKGKEKASLNAREKEILKNSGVSEEDYLAERDAEEKGA